MSALIEHDDTARARRDAADRAVIERAQQIAAERHAQTLTRPDIHQAERELDHRLTIAAR